jgi:hypothetical protein
VNGDSKRRATYISLTFFLSSFSGRLGEGEEEKPQTPVLARISFTF